MPTGKYERKLYKHTCKICAAEFFNYSKTAKFCSKRCTRIEHCYKNKKGTIKICELCSKEFNAKQKNIRFCSLKCATKSSFELRKQHMNILIDKECQVCGVTTPMFQNQKYCSEQCKGKVQYTIHGTNTTDKQYEKISGNWPKYVTRLCQGKKRKSLTKEILIKKLKEQNYKCALSGVNLTCTLEKGIICMTNASIDRIEAGGPYTEDNIQIVCRALNSWRSNLSTDEFVDWCIKVVNYNKK